MSKDNQHYEKEFELLSRNQSKKYWEKVQAEKEEDIVYRLRSRADIRRNIQTRKSVQEGKPDRLAALLEEAADEIEYQRKISQSYARGEHVGIHTPFVKERLLKRETMKYKDKNAKSPVEVLTNPEAFIVLADRIFVWGEARNITAEGGATSLSQIKKLKEEVKELEDALISGDADGVKDGIGDSVVVLLQICRLAGIAFDDALAAAWEEIKDRKGTMIDGVFHKEVV